MYASAPLHCWLMVPVFLAALILLNEISRRWKWAGISLFILLPTILTIFVWPHTAGAGTTASNWFYFAKAYSALAGCIGFMFLRYNEKLSKNKYMLMFPPAILAINIMEAVVRDFQLSQLSRGKSDEMWTMGGPWNIMNGIAGILNILTICGWMGIVISNKKSKDMLWPDMLWFWIIAYDLWNFAYVYNQGADYSAYAGIALLLSCTICAFFISKGAWLQHRAHTLAFYMMWRLTYPDYGSSDLFSIPGGHHWMGYFIISLIALSFNIVVFIYHFHGVIKSRKHPLKEEIYSESKSYQEVAVMAEI